VFPHRHFDCSTHTHTHTPTPTHTHHTLSRAQMSHPKGETNAIFDPTFWEWGLPVDGKGAV
jgi:hypothetical protein